MKTNIAQTDPPEPNDTICSLLADLTSYQSISHEVQQSQLPTTSYQQPSTPHNPVNTYDDPTTPSTEYTNDLLSGGWPPGSDEPKSAPLTLTIDPVYDDDDTPPPPSSSSQAEVEPRIALRPNA